MKKLIFTLVMLLTAIISAKSFAEEQVTAAYAETYLCGDAFTASIVTQPQMMAQIDEKINYQYAVNTFVRLYDRNDDLTQVNFEKPYQIKVIYAKKTEDDVLLTFRVKLQNLNGKTLNGLASESFILTGQVRDRVIEFLPEIMMPFHMDDDDWEVPLIREKLPVFPLRHILNDSYPFKVSEHWNPLLMEEKKIESMYVKEIRLIYRVPVFLHNWVLHVNPQPAEGDTEGLRFCSAGLKIPAIKNEITQELYKYK